MGMSKNDTSHSCLSKSWNLHRYRFFADARCWPIVLSKDWETFQGIPISSLGAVIRRNCIRWGGRKMVKKLKKWTLTLDRESIIDWAVSFHVSGWPDDALSNECIFMSVWRKTSNTITKKYAKVEKSILDFHAHQNPRIWPKNKMKTCSNVTKYDKLST